MRGPVLNDIPNATKTTPLPLSLSFPSYAAPHHNDIDRPAVTADNP